MFVGAINSTVRRFLAASSDTFKNRPVVVGCSGNFTSEIIISHTAQPHAIYSNDVSLYSSLTGAWLTGQPFTFRITNDDYAFVNDYLTDPLNSVAATMILLDMLTFHNRKNLHQQRMWDACRLQWDRMHEETVGRLIQARDGVLVTNYFAGDVFDHFKAHDITDAVFCCYAPTYSGGYERMYSRLHDMTDWTPPPFRLLDENRRDALLEWMRARKFLWYDDRIVPGLPPVMQQRSGRMRTVYLYSNCIKTPAYFTDRHSTPLPKYPLANAETVLRRNSKVTFLRIKTSELALYKDAFLGRNIEHGAGTWAFAIVADDRFIGFVEFSRSKFGAPEWAYMQADFAIPGTRYKRLSKLVVSLALSGETRRVLERVAESRMRKFTTTAFTDRAVSMKYRGLLDLVKRGQTEAGQKFLNYEGEFNSLSWCETYQKWFASHGHITDVDEQKA